MNLNPFSWSWGEWTAFGRNVGGYTAGVITGAVALGFVSPDTAHQLTDAIANISDGLVKVVTGLASIAAIAAPIYTSLKAKKSAEPASQAKAVADNLRRNGESTIPPEQRKDIIGAVATMPEVRGVVVNNAPLASAIPEPNVVASTADVPK